MVPLEPEPAVERQRRLVVLPDLEVRRGGTALGTPFEQGSHHREPESLSSVLVADLDLDQRRDWLDLFPFLTTRRPDTYGSLTG